MHESLEMSLQTCTPQPKARAHRLKTLSVIGGFLDGVRFDLSAGLNCLIGGRGTGKTTALELVRWALDALPSREHQAAQRRRIESLVEKNLNGGRVELEIETKDGLSYMLSRCAGEEPIVVTSDGSPTAIALRTSRLFQADIYSQDEVERIADQATSQLALLDNFEVTRIAEIEAELIQLHSALNSNASGILPLREKLAGLSDDLNTLSSTTICTFARRSPRFSIRWGAGTIWRAAKTRPAGCC